MSRLNRDAGEHRPVRVWAAPIALGLLSLAGLGVALVADGAGDLVSWLALGVPAAAGVYFPLRRGR